MNTLISINTDDEKINFTLKALSISGFSFIGFKKTIHSNFFLIFLSAKIPNGRVIRNLVVFVNDEGIQCIVFQIDRFKDWTYSNYCNSAKNSKSYSLFNVITTPESLSYNGYKPGFCLLNNQIIYGNFFTLNQIFHIGLFLHFEINRDILSDQKWTKHHYSSSSYLCSPYITFDKSIDFLKKDNPIDYLNLKKLYSNNGL